MRDSSCDAEVTQMRLHDSIDWLFQVGIEKFLSLLMRIYSVRIHVADLHLAIWRLFYGQR